MLQKSVIIMCCFLLMTTILITLAKAQDEDTVLIKTNTALEFPGIVVGPGTYELRFLDSPTGSNVVELSEKNGRGFGLFQVRPISRLNPLDHVQVELQSESGAPARMKDWFVIGSTTGYELTYPISHGASTANSNLSTAAGN